MPHTYTALHYHIVFSTKDREDLITPLLQKSLWAYCARVINDEFRCTRLINGVADHIHICADIHPKHALSDVMRTIKSHSSKWMKEKGTCPTFAWQEGYAAFSVSKSVLPKVITYISEQESHHATHDFKEEFMLLLQRHEVTYDERYIWK